MEQLAYSVDETVKLTGLSRDLLYDEMNAGRLRYVKVGRRRIIPADAIRALVSGQGAAA
jgi:excisionase family DNA binding protein